MRKANKNFYGQPGVLLFLFGENTNLRITKMDILKEKIGLAGLGIMGSGIARRLAAAGCLYSLYNRNHEKAHTLSAELAVNHVQTVDQLAQCSVILIILSDDLACSGFLLHELKPHLKKEHLLINMTTISEKMSLQLKSELPCEYFEAPLIGSRLPAETGQLVLVTGGMKETHKKLQPLFKAISKYNKYIGDVGSAACVKIVNNQIMTLSLLALCEGIHLAEKSGINCSDLLDVIGQGAFANAMFEIKGRNILKENFETHFPLKHAQKDIRYAISLAEKKGAVLPVTAVANEIYRSVRKVSEEKNGNPDFAAVSRFYSK